MKKAKLLSVVALLALSACEVPTLQQRQVLDGMVGKTEVDVVRQFGVPTRSYQTEGHSFLAYIENQTQYSGGGGGWGWGGWGGGWGGPGWGGWGGGWGGPGGWGGGWVAVSPPPITAPVVRRLLNSSPAMSWDGPCAAMGAEIVFLVYGHILFSKTV
mgnify:CR=1 FL=1